MREGEWKERLEQIEQSDRNSEKSPEPTEIAPKPVQSTSLNIRLTKGKLKCKVRELEPNTTYTFSLSSINYLSQIGGTAHVEYKTQNMKPSKSSISKLTREQKQSQHESVEMTVFTATEPEQVDLPLHPVIRSSQHVSCVISFQCSKLHAVHTDKII